MNPQKFSAILNCCNVTFHFLTGEAADKLFEELRTSHPQHVFVFSAMLQCLEPEAKKLLPGFKSDYSQEDDEQLVKVASSAIEAIDEKELLVFIGNFKYRFF